MFSINLVPEIQQRKQQVAERNTYATIFAVVILGACVVTLLVMGGVKVAKSSQLLKAKEEIVRLEDEASIYKELEETVVSLEKGLAGINEINDGKYTWTRILPHLEKATPSDVQFTSLSLEENTITANLKGKNIDSLARFVESFKNYQVVSMSGNGIAGEKLTISIDSDSESTITIKSDGTWTYAANFDPTLDHVIVILKDGEETKIGYSSEDKKLLSNEAQITTSVINLFSTVETTQYSKEGSQVSFDSSITFEKEAIW